MFKHHAVASNFLNMSMKSLPLAWKKAIKKVSRDFSYGPESQYNRVMDSASEILLNSIVNDFQSYLMRYTNPQKKKLLIHC